MSGYWKSHYDSKVDRFETSLLKQVDRTLNGEEMSGEQLDLCVQGVVDALGLAATDRVIDLCCGNGLITKIIAGKVATVVGADFSEKLVEQARTKSEAPNVAYVVADVTTLAPNVCEGVGKAYMRDSVSCFSSESLDRLLRQVGAAPSVKCIYISGVPDAEKLTTYYDTEEKMAFYREREATGRPHIGTWWSREEMRELVESAGWSVRFLAQDARLLSAPYRYDCLLQRP
jgi:SAM-dependent methyltransferase